MAVARTLVSHGRPEERQTQGKRALETRRVGVGVVAVARRAARGTGDADTGKRTGGEPELDRARERSTFYKSIARGILKIRPYL